MGGQLPIRLDAGTEYGLRGSIDYALSPYPAPWSAYAYKEATFFDDLKDENHHEDLVLNEEQVSALVGRINNFSQAIFQIGLASSRLPQTPQFKEHIQELNKKSDYVCYTIMKARRND